MNQARDENCEIHVNSKKYGLIKVLVDGDVFPVVSAMKWVLSVKVRNGRNYYYFWNAGSRKEGRSWKSMHRFITKCAPGLMVDHVNGDTLDNRKANLRIVSASENTINSKLDSRLQSSKYRGVHKSYDKWGAVVVKDKEILRIGSFDSEEEAAMAYDRMAYELHGEFRRDSNFSTLKSWYDKSCEENAALKERIRELENERSKNENRG